MASLPLASPPWMARAHAGAGFDSALHRTAQPLLRPLKHRRIRRLLDEQEAALWRWLRVYRDTRSSPGGGEPVRKPAWPHSGACAREH
jgi:hypothetical protein